MTVSSETLLPHTLIRRVRLVSVGGVAAPDELVDLRVADGLVREVAPTLGPRAGEELTDADGRWAIPGLWDHHVHMSQWASTLSRVDMSGAAGPDEVLARVRAHLDTLPVGGGASVVVGYGHRSATWERQPTVAELDDVSGDHPIVLVSGDGHNGWCNSAALALLEAPPSEGALAENDWFPAFARLDGLPGAQPSNAAAYSAAVAKASASGIVGIGDMEFGSGYLEWPARFARGIQDLKVRAATYPDGLDDIVAAGLRSGNELGESGGLLQMGPLKIISDGSLNTRTAYCHEPYADGASLEHPRGRPNLTSDQLVDLCRRATAHGLTVAVHAIGDAAVAQALDAFEQTGAVGGLEHAQLVGPEDLARMARLGVSASVQPAHLLDDRDVTMTCWPDRADRCFPLRSMIDAGIALRMGSDAPVSPLDPWLAMAAAVHRTADDRPPWNPEQAISPGVALAASTDGQTTLAVGSRADIVLLDQDPVAPTPSEAESAHRLRSTRVETTFLAGRRTFG